MSHANRPLSYTDDVETIPASEETMPIEDVTIEWPESESPYRTVAQLVLPRRTSRYCVSRMSIRTSRTMCGMRSPHIVPWEESTASAVWPTRSHPHGVVNKLGRNWRSQRGPTKPRVESCINSCRTLAIEQ